MWLTLVQGIRRIRKRDCKQVEEIGEEKLKSAVYQKIRDNVKRNLNAVFIIIYGIGLAIWNLLTMLLIGDIDLRIFALLLIDSINLPVLIIMGIVWTGKWKTLNYEKDIADRAHALEIQNLKIQYESRIDLLNERKDHEREVALLQQQIEHLNIVREQYDVIDKQRKELLYERSISEYQLRLVGALSNQKWEDLNDALGKIDKDIREKTEERLNAISIGAPECKQGE